ncbi:MAG: peptidoglycan DD-metalloendopeptidase family protein [Syntrophobacterales bacterium]|nr:peptidoglycan DD-metalloendopeptidase family protein [Syntrophobacterales bacterium]
MGNLRLVRGAMGILVAMVLSSIKAEGIINNSPNPKNLKSNINISSEWEEMVFKGTCNQRALQYSPIKNPPSRSKEINNKKSTISPQLKTITGFIDDNLYNCGIKAGLPPYVILDLTEIFSSHIDFTTDLKKGDTFSVLLGRSDQNSKTQKWQILAARIELQGEVYEAFLFQTNGQKGAYYDDKGRPMKRAFLRAPLQYRRISSVFTKKRVHPILKIPRAHFGIDYAAPTGTPVSAIGAGKVVFVGRKGGFGNYVEIRHSNVYSSSYGHLSKFAKGLKVGKQVEQGEVIGYVGKTGLATGPHLDFRFYANGCPVNFVALSNTISYDPMPKSLERKFQTTVEYYRTLMGQKESRKVAKVQTQ